jgi:hypothetical protein
VNNWLSRHAMPCTAWLGSAFRVGQHEDQLLVPHHHTNYVVAGWEHAPGLRGQQQWQGFVAMPAATHNAATPNSAAVQLFYHTQNDCTDRASEALWASAVAAAGGAVPAIPAFGNLLAMPP